jgi:hypothetical protein
MPEARYASFAQALPHLHVADIVLVRHRRGLLYRAIRTASRSYWNHMAMVFATPQETGLPPNDALIIEALERGIEIHRLQQYAREPELYDLGIKRVEDLTGAERDRIRGYFLDALETPYDFSRLFTYLVKDLIARIGGVRVTDFIKRKVINPDTFICSSFAQRALYLALPAHKRERAFFNAGQGMNFLDQMEAITPGDIARSRNTVWLYNPHD